MDSAVTTGARGCSADRGHAPLGFERIDTAGQPEQLALRGTAAGHDPRLREEDTGRVRPLFPEFASAATKSVSGRRGSTPVTLPIRSLSSSA